MHKFYAKAKDEVIKEAVIKLGISEEQLKAYEIVEDEKWIINSKKIKNRGNLYV